MKKILILVIFIILGLNTYKSYSAPHFVCSVANETLSLIDNSVTFDIYINTTSPADTIFLGPSNWSFMFNLNNFKLSALSISYIDGTTTGFYSRTGADVSGYYNGDVAGNGISISYYGNGELDSTIYIDMEFSGFSTQTQFNQRVARITNQTNTHRVGTFKVMPVQNFAGYRFGLYWKHGAAFWPLIGNYAPASPWALTNMNDPSLGDTTSIPNLPLPVSLSYFNTQVNNNSVNLLWETANEYNNASFIIERMISGTSTWSKIGVVQGHGNSNSPVKYMFEDQKLSTNIYNYRLKQVDYNGNFEYFNLNQSVRIGKPGSFSLGQNYPNPSNPVAKIDYQIPFDSRVKIVVYDLIGREVVKLVDENKQAGYYSAIFDGTSLASGVYIYRIIAENSDSKFEKSMKMVLIK